MKKKILVVLMVVLFGAIHTYAQFGYDLAFGLGLNADDQGYAITADAQGNFYCTGFHTYWMNLNPLSTPYYVYNNSTAATNMYVAKYNADGIMQWGFDLGGISDAAALKIALDANNNVYLTGRFTDTVDFDPGSGVANRISNGNADIFIAKYDNNGNFKWANTMGGTQDDQGNDVTVDATTGNVIITGVYQSASMDMDSGTGRHIINNDGNPSFNTGNCFVAAYSGANGAFEWAFSVGGYFGAEGDRVTADGQGNFYLGGLVTGDSTDFDPSDNSDWVYSDANGAKFLAKYTVSGSIVWANSTLGEGGLTLDGQACDKAGNVYQSGYFNAALAQGDSIDFGTGGAHRWMATGGTQAAYVAKYNGSNGNLGWAFGFGGYTGSEVAQDLALDNNGHFFITGAFADTIDFDPGPAVHNLYDSFGTSAVYLAEYDTAGNFMNVMGMMANTGVQFGIGVCAIGTDKVGVTGFFSADTINFGTGSTVHNLYVNGANPNFTDAFVAVYFTNGDTSTGISQLLAAQARVYPNPTSGKFIVQLPGNENNCTADIYDVMGRLVQHSVLSNPQSVLNLSSQSPGVYFISFKSEGEEQVQKVVVQR